MKKFEAIFESNFTRFQGGGVLTGDLVRLKKEILNSEWSKKAGGPMLEQVQKFLDSDLNIRSSSVKTERPAVQGSVQADVGASNVYYADVTLEKTPGNFTDFLELPVEFLEHVDTGINLSPIPDSMKREDEVVIDPAEYKVGTTGETDPGAWTQPYEQTRNSDGSSNEVDMTDSNTTLPGAKAADSYTGGYMV